MEWQLPIQKVEIGNIHIGNPWKMGKEYYQSSNNGGPRDREAYKPMVPLSYFGTHFRLPFITLLFPPLEVLEYQPVTGRLVLDMSISNLACIKLNTLQETLVNAIVYHQNSWFHTHFTKEEIKNGFQPIIEQNKIILYLPAPKPSQKNQISPITPVYSLAADGIHSVMNPFEADSIRIGQRIRVAIKIHGISFLTRPDDQQNEQIWSGRSRLQHRVQGIIIQS